MLVYHMLRSDAPMDSMIAHTWHHEPGNAHHGYRLFVVPVVRVVHVHWLGFATKPDAKGAKPRNYHILEFSRLRFPLLVLSCPFRLR